RIVMKNAAQTTASAFHLRGSSSVMSPPRRSISLPRRLASALGDGDEFFERGAVAGGLSLVLDDGREVDDRADGLVLVEVVHTGEGEDVGVLLREVRLAVRGGVVGGGEDEHVELVIPELLDAGAERGEALERLRRRRQVLDRARVRRLRDRGELAVEPRVRRVGLLVDGEEGLLR